MGLLTDKQIDSFLDVTFIGLVFLALLMFFERRRAKKKDRMAIFRSWRIFYALVAVVAFGFFQGIGFNLAWMLISGYAIRSMYVDYKNDLWEQRCLKESALAQRQMRNT